MEKKKMNEKIYTGLESLYYTGRKIGYVENLSKELDQELIILQGNRNSIINLLVYYEYESDASPYNIITRILLKYFIVNISKGAPNKAISIVNISTDNAEEYINNFKENCELVARNFGFDLELLYIDDNNDTCAIFKPDKQIIDEFEERYRDIMNTFDIYKEER